MNQNLRKTLENDPQLLEEEDRQSKEWTKGQLIWKCLFSVFDSPKKMNENNSTCCTIVVKFIHSEKATKF